MAIEARRDEPLHAQRAHVAERQWFAGRVLGLGHARKLTLPSKKEARTGLRLRWDPTTAGPG
jgi:hypothetical protein